MTEADPPEEKREIPTAPTLQVYSESEIEEILQQHKLWLESKGEEGTKAVLDKVVLENAYLQGADLRGAELRMVILEGSELQWANLFKVDLEQAVQRPRVFLDTLEGPYGPERSVRDD